MLLRTLAALTLSFGAAAPLSTHAQGVPMDRTALITSRPFDVRIVANGDDVTAK